MLEVAQKFHAVEYRHAEIIIKEGDIGDFLIVLYEGKVNIQREQDKKKGKETEIDAKIAQNLVKRKSQWAWNIKKENIAIRSAPDLLGEAALKHKEKRAANVIAEGYCRVLVLYKRDYEKAITNALLNLKRENQLLCK
jgi:CRP-like cAMP-binding protein